MTEEEWRTNEFSGRMLEHSRRITALTWITRCRKYRLVATAVLREFLRTGSQERSIEQQVIEIVDSAERVWEGQGSRDALVQVVRAAEFQSGPGVDPEWGLLLADLVDPEPFTAVRGVVGRTQYGRAGAKSKFRALQCEIIRDIFGNPFRPTAFSLEWRTDSAVSLAKQMYDSREFGAMPILADALQDAGCDNDDILNHCRDANQVHVRGCWVVDLVLGKA